MDRKVKGTVAVFIIATAIIVAGVLNQYIVNNAGSGSDATESETTAPAANSETADPQTTNPTDEPDAAESETTPTGESDTSEPETTPADSTMFRVIVNEVQELEVLVPVNVVDGLTREEAELIAEATFVQVKGEEILHRLDSLMLDENSIEAHYTWGLNEGDTGHFFDITVDISSRLITVAHCF